MLLSLHDSLSFLSYTTEGHQIRGVARQGSGPPTSIINQDNALQTSLQTFPVFTFIYVKPTLDDSKKSEEHTPN